MLVNFIYIFITLPNCKAHLIMFSMKNALYKFQLLLLYAISWRISRDKKFLQVTPLEACQDPTFSVRLLMDTVRFKESRHNTPRCKVRWAALRPQWRNFIVYTKKGISVEKIPLDAAYWDSPKQKLSMYYFRHFIRTAASEFANC